MNFFRALVLGTICLCSEVVWAGGVQVTSAKLDEYGIYQEKVATRESATKTSAGYINRTSSQTLIKMTDEIEGVVGVSFGITYTLTGVSAGANAEIITRITHPAITNPDTGETFTVDENPAVSVLGAPNYDGFTFEKPWEIAPGKWTFQILHGSQVILEKSFIVREPKAK